MYDKRKENSDDALLLLVARLQVKATDIALSQREFRRLENLLLKNPAAREY
jgi:hypothetical protein